MSRELTRRGATLAEIMVGILVFALFAMAVLGMLVQAADLSRRDAEINQVNQLTQRYLEEALMAARDPSGYQNLASMPLQTTIDPHYLYSMDVENLTQGSEDLGLKKIAVCLYYADPYNPNQPDPQRVRGGLALCLSTHAEAP